MHCLPFVILGIPSGCHVDVISDLSGRGVRKVREGMTDDSVVIQSGQSYSQPALQLGQLYFFKIIYKFKFKLKT